MTKLGWPNGGRDEPPCTDAYGPRGWSAAGVRAFHTGDDSAGYARIMSIGAGAVVETGWSGWAGNYALVYLGEIDGRRTWVKYCHLASPSPLSRGDQVGLGDFIGTMGATGVAYGVHLHMEMYLDRVDRGGGTGPGDVGTTIDPRAFIRARLDEPNREETMIRLIRTDKGNTYVVNHGDASYWNVHEGIPAKDVPARIDWLKAQGLIEVHGLQPEAMLRGYSWVHAPENEAKAAKAAAEKSATGGVEVSAVVSEAVDQIAGKLKRALD